MAKLEIRSDNELRTITLRSIADLAVLHRLWLPDDVQMRDYGTHQGLTLILPAGKRKAVQDWARILGMSPPMEYPTGHYFAFRDHFPDFAWLHWHTLHVSCPRVSIETDNACGPLVIGEPA